MAQPPTNDLCTGMTFGYLSACYNIAAQKTLPLDEMRAYFDACCIEHRTAAQDILNAFIHDEANDELRVALTRLVDAHDRERML
jgi:hypothetical protein